MMPKKPLIEFPVDRLQAESDKAWKAFKDYCELGENRSPKLLHEFYFGDGERTATYSGVPPTKKKQQLKNWSSQHKWAQRSGEYDAIREGDRLRILREEEEAKWRQEAEAYRDRNKRAGAALFELTIMMTKKSTQAIINAEFTPDQAIKAATGIAKTMEAAQATEGAALGITQLLNNLDG